MKATLLERTVMAFKKSISVLIAIVLLSAQVSYGLDNLTRNDPYPLYSSVYPYAFLSTRQKAFLRRFEYAYPVDKFRVSISGFMQFANRGRDIRRNVVQLGDMNGRWNMLGLFYDEPLRNKLFQALGIYNVLGTNTQPGCAESDPIDPPIDPLHPVTCICDPALTVTSTCTCYDIITDYRKSDRNKEFGYFSIPIDYQKFGVRFESEIFLIDKCFYAVGLLIQGGVVDIRQSVRAFNDLTCQALGTACPVFDPNGETITDTCALPNPVPPTGVVPPFVDTNTTDGIPNPPCNLAGTVPFASTDECAVQVQKFKPCCNSTCCFAFTCDCKRLVIERIMKQKQLIANILGINLCDYHKVGIEDLRLSLFWRQLVVLNEESDIYPRLIFMPFATLGVGIPMEKAAPTYKPFAVPIGNNNHVSVGATAGFTLDFLDTIDISCVAGITHFFKHKYCNLRLPTNIYESGIFPYTADACVQPGLTWHLGIGMNAYHFLDNLSCWAEYVVVSHAQDSVEICRSFIPSTSRYFKTGFIVEDTECYTKWESQLFNIGFNYDLSDNLVAGALFQIPVRQRNAYRAGMVMGTLTFVY